MSGDKHIPIHIKIKPERDGKFNDNGSYLLYEGPKLGWIIIFGDPNDYAFCGIYNPKKVVDRLVDGATCNFCIKKYLKLIGEK